METDGPPVSVSRRLLLIVPAIVLASCEISSEVHNLKNVDRARVLEVSKFDFIPVSAQHLYTSMSSFQDMIEYFYFQAPRKDVDAFCERLLGFVPPARANFPFADFDLKGWPKPPEEGGRSGNRNESEVGMREVMIVDQARYSEVWVEVWNWCQTCETADLTGKPPGKFDMMADYGPPIP